MRAAKTAQTEPNSAREGETLDRCYGKIGISAVAAAVRYQAEPRQNGQTAVIPQDTD